MGLFMAFVVDLLEDRYNHFGFSPQNDTEHHMTILSRMSTSHWMCKLDYKDCLENARNLFDDWMTNSETVPADIKDVVFNTAIRTGDAKQWNFLLEKFKTTKVDSDRQKYMTALAATVDQETLLKYLNMTIYPEDYGIRVSDIGFIYESVTRTKNGGDLAMKWLQDNYEEILNSLGEGGGEAGGGGFSRIATTIIDGFASTSNTHEDVDIINEFVDTHQSDFQLVGNSIKASLKKVELNIQWNELHLQKVIQWLKTGYGSTTTISATTSTTVSTTASTTASTTTSETTANPTTTTYSSGKKSTLCGLEMLLFSVLFSLT